LRENGWVRRTAAAAHARIAPMRAASPSSRSGKPVVQLHDSGLQIAVVAHIQVIGAAIDEGTMGVSVSVAPLTQGAIPALFIVTVMMPAATTTDSEYFPAPEGMSSGTPTVPPSIVERSAPLWIRSAIDVRRPSTMPIASASCALPV